MSDIIINSPVDAVFGRGFAKGHKALFKNQIELVDAIRKEPGFTDKKEITVRSSISQIFTGERNLSKTLGDVLFNVIEYRFDKSKYNFKDYRKLLEEAFRRNYEERMIAKRVKSSDRDYDNLIEATRKSGELLITTLEPAELHKSTLADLLKNELLEKTGIIQRKGSDVVAAKYVFYLPNTKDGYVARNFWEQLRDYILDLEDGYTLDSINKKLEEINTGENARIKTYLVEEKIALYPFVFLNYSDKNRVKGFCVSYVSDVPSVAELSNDVVYTWRKDIYPELAAISTPDNEYVFNNLI